MVKNSGMDLIETQLKLAAQKWKAKCRMTKHDQSWQDEDVSLSAERERGRGREGGRDGGRELPYLLFSLQILFLGKVSDELLVKVIEVKKIQGNVHVGSIKCFTREFFSFYPMVSIDNSHL